MVKIECYMGNYVALIGGYANNGDGVSTTEIFNLEDGTILKTDAMNSVRISFAAAFDPEDEKMYVFGGVITANGDSCTDRIEVTNVTSMGICRTYAPSMDPTTDPTDDPMNDQTNDPTDYPSIDPTMSPTTATPTTVAPNTQQPVTAAPSQSSTKKHVK